MESWMPIQLVVMPSEGAAVLTWMDFQGEHAGMIVFALYSCNIN